MGRKIKTMVSLVILLVMIYCQQATIYAEKLDTAQGKPWKSSSEDQEEKNEGEDKKENDKTGSKEEGGDIKDGEKEGDEKEDDEEEKIPIQKYQLEFPEPDGRNGYYVTVPEIRLSHVDSRGKTKYSLMVNGAVKTEGVLNSGKESAALSEGLLEEGENILTVSMEDDAGIALEEFGCIKKFYLDLTDPQFELQTPKGFEAWYQKEAWVSVTADDGERGSQIASISCYCGNQRIGTVKESYGEFLIDQACDSGRGVSVTVTVTDGAGRKSERTQRLYIDNQAPQTVIGGIEDYMITGQAVEAVFQVREDNELKELSAEVEWESADGEKQLKKADSWVEKDGGRESAVMLTEDGIYHMKVSAVDLAGYQSEKEAQIIIDSHNPVIRYVDDLDGKFMKRFCWNYSKEEFIDDFTSYVHQIQLDGELYPTGKETEEEGKHVLKIEAIDAAGNKAEAKAGFVIDHTPPEILFLEIEADELYEEEKTFKVALKNPEDEIQEIRINGSPQPVGREKTAYQYTVQEPSEYEVTVKARDKAGNFTAADIMFEVTPKETFLQKAVKPVKRLFRSSVEEDGSQVKDSMQEDTENRRMRGVVVVVFAGLAVCGLGAGVIFWKRRN